MTHRLAVQACLPAWPGSDQDHQATSACFTDSITPLLRFGIPLQRSLVASRHAREMPAPELIPLRRWLGVARALPYKSPRALASSLRFSAFANPTAAVRRVATREMLSERVDSPHHEGAVPSRAAVESPGRHGHVSGSRDCSPDWLTCHAGLHQSVRRSPASHAPRLLDARRSATRGSANSAAWPNDCGGLLRDFASFGGAHGVQIFPSQS